MALAGTAGAELHEVVIALHKRNHAKKKGVPLPVAQLARLDADGPEQKGLPFFRRELLPRLRQRIQYVALGQLNFPQGRDAKRATLSLLCDSNIERHAQLGVEA